MNYFGFVTHTPVLLFAEHPVKGILKSPKTDTISRNKTIEEKGGVWV